MDGSLTTPLHFPVAMPPGTGETITIAPGVEWLRMPLPFALDHINLWLLEDGPGWAIVDAGYATAETTARWERIFAERLRGLPVTRIIATHHHPDHIGLAGWLAFGHTPDELATLGIAVIGVCGAGGTWWTSRRR